MYKSIRKLQFRDRIYDYLENCLILVVLESFALG